MLIHINYYHNIISTIEILCIITEKLYSVVPLPHEHNYKLTAINIIWFAIAVDMKTHNSQMLFRSSEYSKQGQRNVSRVIS